MTRKLAQLASANAVRAHGAAGAAERRPVGMLRVALSNVEGRHDEATKRR
jgi:hypothetical protein